MKQDEENGVDEVGSGIPIFQLLSSNISFFIPIFQLLTMFMTEKKYSPKISRFEEDIPEENVPRDFSFIPGG